MKSEEWLVFQQLFRSQIDAVFRYHLICVGDWLAAEVRTAEIFHTALAWFSPRLAQKEAFIPWLWRIAHDSQSRHSTQFSEPERSRGAEVPQSQLKTFACAGLVTAEWNSLPRRVTEPIGLFYFGRLEIPQVAGLTHVSSEQVQRVILQHGSEILDNLSLELHPVGLFSQELEKELEEQSLGKKVYRVPLQRWYLRLTSRFNVPGLDWAPRTVILAIIIVLTVAAWRSFSTTNLFFEDGAAPLTAIVAPPPAFSFPPIQDNLIVVDEFGQIGRLQLDTSALVDPISGFRYFPCANPTHKAADPPNHHIVNDQVSRILRIHKCHGMPVRRPIHTRFGV